MMNIVITCSQRPLSQTKGHNIQSKKDFSPKSKNSSTGILLGMTVSAVSVPMIVKMNQKLYGQNQSEIEVNPQINEQINEQTNDKQTDNYGITQQKIDDHHITLQSIQNTTQNNPKPEVTYDQNQLAIQNVINPELRNQDTRELDKGEQAVYKYLKDSLELEGNLSIEKIYEFNIIVMNYVTDNSIPGSNKQNQLDLYLDNRSSNYKKFIENIHKDLIKNTKDFDNACKYRKNDWENNQENNKSMMSSLAQQIRLAYLKTYLPSDICSSSNLNEPYTKLLYDMFTNFIAHKNNNIISFENGFMKRCLINFNCQNIDIHKQISIFNNFLADINIIELLRNNNIDDAIKKIAEHDKFPKLESDGIIVTKQFI